MEMLNEKYAVKTHEHRARITDPGQYVHFATGEDKGGKGINFIYGIRSKEGPHGGKSEVQAIRFDSNLWTAEKSRAWLKEHEYSPIKFTAATVKEDGEAAPAAAGPAITTTSLGAGAVYAPKVAPMVARFRNFDRDEFDQSFMKKMKKRLNEDSRISIDFDDITPQSRVTIRTSSGKERTGKAVMRNNKVDAWVLNMGGAHGTPGLAFRDNFVKVTGSTKKPKDDMTESSNDRADNLSDAMKTLSAYDLRKKTGGSYKIWSGDFDGIFEKFPALRDKRSQIERVLTDDSEVVVNVDGSKIRISMDRLPKMKFSEETSDPQSSGKNGYIGFYKGKKYEVYADTTYEAQKKIAAQNKIKDSYNITVKLAEKDGKPVVHIATESESTSFADIVQAQADVIKKKLKGKKVIENFGQKEIRGLKDYLNNIQHISYSDRMKINSIMDDLEDWCSTYTGHDD